MNTDGHKDRFSLYFQVLWGILLLLPPIPPPSKLLLSFFPANYGRRIIMLGHHDQSFLILNFSLPVWALWLLPAGGVFGLMDGRMEDIVATETANNVKHASDVLPGLD